MKTVLSIAGFDGSGGAGLQADIKTASALGCYSTNIITAVTVQNTQGVCACYGLPTQAIEDQLVAIFEDIKPAAIKIGMLFEIEIIEVVARFLERYAEEIPIVLDPVMVATSGDELLKPDAKALLIESLFPLSTLVTPNLFECELILNQPIDHLTSGEVAKRLLPLAGHAVLVKGGHDHDDKAVDVLLEKNKRSISFSAKRINTKHTHGTGCTLSSAIACFLAKGYDLAEACQLAKNYLTGAIEAGQHGIVGFGNGPVQHFYQLWDS